MTIQPPVLLDILQEFKKGKLRTHGILLSEQFLSYAGATNIHKFGKPDWFTKFMYI